MFEKSVEELTELGAQITTAEIAQQPELWRDTLNIYRENKEAIEAFLAAGVLYGPAKAANAGGVATSGLEMSQNSMRLHWSPEEVDAKLRAIMQNIHEVCVKYGTEPDGYVNYVKGANIGGFMKVANAMLAQGCC